MIRARFFVGLFYRNAASLTWMQSSPPPILDYYAINRLLRNKRIPAFPIRFAQILFQHFAHCVAGNDIDIIHALGNFKSGQKLTAMSDDGFLADFIAGFQYYNSLDLFAPFLIRYPNNASFGRYANASEPRRRRQSAPRKDCICSVAPAAWITSNHT